MKASMYGLGVGAEVDVEGVLVHVEREDRDAARDRLRMVGGELVHQPASRGIQVSSTQPEPPASAMAMERNCARQRSTEPKSRVSASTSAAVGLPSLWEGSRSRARAAGWN
jgi:hypothetical protein